MQVTAHTSKQIHPGFVAQNRCRQKSKTELSVAPQKGFMSSKFLFKKEKKKRFSICICSGSQIYFDIYVN